MLRLRPQFIHKGGVLGVAAAAQSTFTIGSNPQRHWRTSWKQPTQYMQQRLSQSSTKLIVPVIHIRKQNRFIFLFLKISKICVFSQSIAFWCSWLLLITSHWNFFHPIYNESNPNADTSYNSSSSWGTWCQLWSVGRSEKWIDSKSAALRPLLGIWNRDCTRDKKPDMQMVK